MNRLKDCKVYLAGPVEADNNYMSWRNNISKSLYDMNLIVWNPTIHPSWIQYKITPEIQTQDKKVLNDLVFGESIRYDRLKANDYIRKVCLRLVSACDFIICKIDKPTVGTYEELSLAKLQNKPILFLSKNLDSCWRAAQFYDIASWFKNEKELLNHLKCIDNGDDVVDNLNWIFLKGIWNET